MKSKPKLTSQFLESAINPAPARCTVKKTCHLLILSALLTTPTSFGQARVTLGQAAKYAILGNNLQLDNVTIHGDVGVGPNGSIKVASPSTISGSLYLDAGATKSIVGKIYGPIYQPYAVNQALVDASAAAALAASLNPHIVLSAVTQSIQVNAAAEQTVVNITGSIDLTTNACLYFNGPTGSKFIVNVFGSFVLNGRSVVGALPRSGLTGSDILINVVGTGPSVSTHVNNIVQGTILAPSRQFVLHNISGAVIGGNLGLKLMSAATVTYAGFVPLPPLPSVPPPTGQLNVSNNVFLQGVRIPVTYNITRNSGN